MINLCTICKYLEVILVSSNVYNKNYRGPKTEPCGALGDISWFVDIWTFVLQIFGLQLEITLVSSNVYNKNYSGPMTEP